MRKLLLLASPLLLVACATTMTDKAAKVQVHNQMSTLVANCKNLGPINANAQDIWVGGQKAAMDAKVKARELAADAGGDTLVIVNTDTFGQAATVQGVAMKCY